MTWPDLWRSRGGSLTSWTLPEDSQSLSYPAPKPTVALLSIPGHDHHDILVFNICIEISRSVISDINCGTEKMFTYSYFFNV